MLKRHLVYKDETITYYIKKGKYKNLKLQITPEGDLVVLAPQKASIEQIEVAMANHRRLMYNRHTYVENKKAQGGYAGEKQYITGDTIRFLGKMYTIKLLPGEQTRIYLKDQEMVIVCPEEFNPEQRLHLIKRHALDQARKLFPRLLNQEYEKFAEDYNLPQISLTIREMKTRWGSCNPRAGKITLNLALMQVAEDSILEVVVHELCHLIQPNHSKKFYALMDKYLPNWRDHNKIINTTASTTQW